MTVQSLKIRLFEEQAELSGCIFHTYPVTHKSSLENFNKVAYTLQLSNSNVCSSS